MSPSRIKWRTQYDDEADARERKATDIYCPEDVQTSQDLSNSDINLIVARFGINDGSSLPTNLGFPITPEYYGDFTEIPDLRGALDAQRNITEIFAELPAKVRSRFQNDPYALWEFVNDSNNVEEAVTLGLLSRIDPTPNKADSGQPAPAPGASAPDPVPPK